MLLARSEISKSPTFGLEMVSIAATVSPKSLFRFARTRCPATVGKSLIESSRPWRSCQTSSVFLTVSNNSTKTTDKLCRLREWTFSTWLHWLTCFSILRVTSCSTFSDCAPG